MNNNRLSWTESFSLYLKRPVLVMLVLGFFAGLPFLLVFSTLAAWLTEYGTSRSAIGLFGWVGITYSIKVLWAPVVDNLRLPIIEKFLGKRRSWLLLAQAGICAGLLAMASLEPDSHLFFIALSAVFVAFCSATQDIVIDAYRIEIATPEYQAAMAATFILGYRLAMLIAGAGALYIAEFSSWPAAYAISAGLMALGALFTLGIREPEEQSAQHGKFKLFTREWLKNTLVDPFVEFFSRNGSSALLILAFIGLFRLSDITMGIMANPFYLDLGFSKIQIANASKIFGFAMTITGGFVGGLCVARFGVHKVLIAGACMVALTNLLFVKLALVGADINWLIITISADNLSAGLAATSFIAYLSGLTNRAYTATQYALFSSIMTLPGKFQSGFSGIIVDNYGYVTFFSYAAVMGIPAVILAILVWKRRNH